MTQFLGFLITLVAYGIMTAVGMLILVALVVAGTGTRLSRDLGSLDDEDRK